MTWRQRLRENLAGSESAFAERMTRTARSIGMSRTTYRNASGLPDPGQKTTARDMATLGLRLQRDFPRQFAYFSRGSFTYGGRVVRNHNRLLGRLRGVDGIKTGYTRASGFNLVTSAGRDGRRVVGVVMGGVSGGARNRYMAAMVETAFPKVSKGSVIALAAGRVTGASAVAAAGPQAEPAKVRMASVPVPRPKPEVAEPDMALVPVSVAADSDDDEEAQAQEASVSANDPVLTADRPVDGPGALADGPDSDAADDAEANDIVAAVVPSAPAGRRSSFADDEPLPIDPNASAVSVGKADSLFVARQATTATVLKPMKPVRASLTATMTTTTATYIEPAAASPRIDNLARHARSWNIQVGAFPTADAARSRINSAQSAAAAALKNKAPFTMPVSRGAQTIFRARFSGFTEDQARETCKQLTRKGVGCFPLAPQT